MSFVPSRRSTENPTLGFLQAGAGESVLLLHGSAASSVMWRPVIELLQPLYQVIAPDLIGYGHSPPWAGTDYSVADEVHAIRPLLPCCRAPFHLVGYGYGGVVALALALENPLPVRTLALIEPVLLSALRRIDPATYAQFEDASARFHENLDGCYPATAINRFLNFWCGDGTWERHSAETRMAMLDAIQKVDLDWRAAFAFAPDRVRLALLGGRTALFGGEQSSEPMRRMLCAVGQELPGARRASVPGANHLLPLTHPTALVRLLLEHVQTDSERRPH